MIERWSLKERVKEQIEYDALCTQYAVEDVDALVELIAEMQSSTAAAIRLGKDQIPIEIIKERFRQLNQMHVAYVLDSLRTTTTQSLSSDRALQRADDDGLFLCRPGAA